jgi:hypothetical protein
MLMVSSAEPKLMVSATVLLVAILIVFPALPVPILIVLELLEVPKLRLPVVPESMVRALLPVLLNVPPAAKAISVAEKEMVSMEDTPVNAPAVVTFNPVDDSWNCPVALPMVVLDPADEERVVLPDDERVVNEAVEGVVVPIAVELMPVSVTLKFAEVIVKLLVPVEMDEALRPERFKAPEVEVKFKAPVVNVSPLEAVIKPAEVIVPEDVVEILPVVERLPFSVIVKLSTPPDWIARAVWPLAALVSLMIKAVAVPALVKLKDVGVAKPEANVKSIFLPVVVTMVLPASYAA